MNCMKLALLAALGAAVVNPAFAAASDPLPGEGDSFVAISPAPFPDRISAFVWRNWFLVPHDRLAATVKSTAAEIDRIGLEMGLPANPKIPGEWLTRGYITVVRRNWHLLPYDQLLTLLGKTREQLRFCLIEEDFLWHKLGCRKPKCEPLTLTAEIAARGREARHRIARVLREEGVDPAAAEEPRFTFADELSRPMVQPAVAAAKSESPFDFRLIFSYFADYGDPLGDPDVRSFPEGLLQRLSAQGVNAVWLHTVLRTLAKDPKYPEFGEGCEQRLANLQKLVDRAGKYGIKVYLYMNEPRGMEPPFFARNGRASLAGAQWNGLVAMCTSDPETHRWVSDSLAKVFSTVHGLGGIFTITASENLTNCATRPGDKETCARCKAKSRGEIIAEATGAMIEGMHRGDPDAQAILYNWAWPEDEIKDILARLPSRHVRIMAVSEHGMKIHRGGVEVKEEDYSISIVGPGELSQESWVLAKARGMGAVAKVQVCNSWELSSYPYLPTMDLVAQHAVNLANVGVRGVMLSWSTGCCPAPNLRVYSELRPGETTPEPMLDRLAKDLYGEKAPQARKAWTAFSKGFANYPFSCMAIYNGPHQWGPANPLYLEKTGWKATMVGIPYDDLDGWRDRYPRETYVALWEKVAAGFAEGCHLMEGVADPKELNMFRAEQMHFASCADQSRFVIARDAGDLATMKEIAFRELQRAKEFLPLVRADSRIGYESSNHYFFTPVDVIEKILSCRVILDK